MNRLESRTYRELHPGMGQAVAERTILRRKEDNSWENWGDVAHRVALGNSLLAPKKDQNQEYEILRKHIANASLLMSGRHLQHGDEEQPTRNLEVFTNCSTSASSFILFYLLLNGSGVGRCYDDDMMLVDWDNAPNIRCVLDESHPDFDWSAHESVRDAKHKYGSGKDVLWFRVPDSREGWAKALEIWENAAFEKIHKDKLLILVFSDVREKGQPIGGMQNRPASGPVPLMNAFNKAATLKGGGLDRWLQALYIDHYFAECVLVGGARRAARMSTKFWKDHSVLDFITVKRPVEYQGLKMDDIIQLRESAPFPPMGFLWSSNNSVTVDEEFWKLALLKRTEKGFHDELAQHARRVLRALTQSSYGDGTGEPGIINVDHLVQKNDNWAELTKDVFVKSEKYQLEEDTEIYLGRLAKRAKRKKYTMITNPCLTADTMVLTSDGPKEISDLIDTPFTAIVDGNEYQATGFWKTGDKQVFRVKTNRGYEVRATVNHKILVERSRRRKYGGGYNHDQEWIEVGDLKVGDKIVLNNHRSTTVNDEGFDRGWLLGEMVGDGGFNPSKYPSYLRFWGDSKELLKEKAVSYVKSLNYGTRSGFIGYGGGNTCTVANRTLDQLAEGLIEEGTKTILPALEKKGDGFVRGFLRGIFDADGTVLVSSEKGRSVRLSQSNEKTLKSVQRMLSRFGIASSIHHRRPTKLTLLPDGKGDSKLYKTKDQYELIVSRDNIPVFAERIGFSEPDKIEKLGSALKISRGWYADTFTTEVTEVVSEGIEAVYDCTIDEVHAFDANGIMVHNCGEIALIILGGYCTIADVVPFFCDSLDEAEEAFRAATRALMRVNTMDCLYRSEVNRTNRIGVGVTGIHEFAWKFFGYGFRDLIDEEKSKDFWMAMSRFNRAVYEEAVSYSKHLGVEVPHTMTTIKPAGTTSKLFGLTEGWHLPSMAWYMRWVQFRHDDPLVEDYKTAGYPHRELKQYEGTVIIGFPTEPTIASLGMGGHLVTAGEATPEEQYKWLMLGEKYWIHGVQENGVVVEENYGNQISYCLAGEKNHLIPTENGMQRIEDITPSAVPNRNGNAQKIINLVDNGIKDTLSVKIQNGAEIIATEEHRLLTVNENLKFIWKRMKEVTPGDIVVRRVGDNIWCKEYFKLPPIQLVGTDNIKRNLNTACVPEIVTEDMGLFLGMLMADGSVGINGISFTTADIQISLLFQSLVKSLFNLKTTVGKDKRSNSIIIIQCNSRPLSRWLKLLLVNTNHDYNFIPNCILKSPKKVIQSFIRGYTLDGHVNPKGWANICTTVSETMAKDTAAVMWNLGYDAYIGKKEGRPYKAPAGNTGMGKDQYVVYLGANDSINFVNNIGFAEQRKNNEVVSRASTTAMPHKKNAIPSKMFHEIYEEHKNTFEGKEKLRGIIKAQSTTISMETVKLYFSKFKEISHIMDENLRFTKVTSVSNYMPLHTYDISVDVSHEYIANSVVVHNTLKYVPEQVDYKHFKDMLIDYQRNIRCCSVMPQTDVSSYEYQPEQSVTKAEYEAFCYAIEKNMEEDIGKEHVDCDSGACPVDFKIEKEVA